MKAEIWGLLAETSIHPGSGQDAGFVDLPVAREAATDYPVIVGSSFKGALLDRATADNLDEQERKRIFGKQENAGNLIVSDIRLVALPVRSLTSTYKWVTCPHLIERLSRDRKRTGNSEADIAKIDIQEQHYLGKGGDDLYLEERQFSRSGDLPDGILGLFESLIPHKNTAHRLQDQLVILHNDDFAWFARYGLAVNARNVLDNEKKTSKNLWYEETIPPDSIFYALLAERKSDAISRINELFKEKPYLQVGGNETVGQGIFAIRLDVCKQKGGSNE